MVSTGGLMAYAQCRCGFSPRWHSLFLLTFPRSSSGVWSKPVKFVRNQNPESQRDRLAMMYFSLAALLSSGLSVIFIALCFPSLVDEEMIQCPRPSNRICQYHIPQHVGWKYFPWSLLSQKYAFALCL